MYTFQVLINDESDLDEAFYLGIIDYYDYIHSLFLLKFGKKNICMGGSINKLPIPIEDLPSFITVIH